MGCSLADELIIGHRVPCGSVGGHFLCWHTGDSVVTDLLRVLTPLLNSLVHDTLHLPLTALVSRTLATLAEVCDRVLWRRERLDHDLVVRVLDCCDCHGVPCFDPLIIHEKGSSTTKVVPLPQLSHPCFKFIIFPDIFTPT